MRTMRTGRRPALGALLSLAFAIAETFGTMRLPR